MKRMLQMVVGLASAVTFGGLSIAGETANSIFVISPYFKHGTWVFDDEKRGLVEEPFVAGVPEIINSLVVDIPDAEKGFRLTFSASPFPGHELAVVRGEAEAGGYWYTVSGSESKGWLCPALFKFFQTAPENLYVKADPL